MSANGIPYLEILSDTRALEKFIKFPEGVAQQFAKLLGVEVDALGVVTQEIFWEISYVSYVLRVYPPGPMGRRKLKMILRQDQQEKTVEGVLYDRTLDACWQLLQKEI